MIVPERAAARKASAKLKVSHQDKTAGTAELSDFKVPSGGTAPPTPNTDGLSKLSSKKSKKSSASNPVAVKDESEESSSSSSDEEVEVKTKKKTSKSDRETEEALGYVPQRKAAQKASAQMKDADRVVSKKEEDLLLFGDKPAAPAKKSSKKKGESLLPPLSQRILSDLEDSDEEPFQYRSPRGHKSPRGRAVVPRSPRKSVKRTAPPPPAIKKGLSERALSFLSQRESQLDDIFEQCGFGTKKSKEPDTKLKTSEGQSQDVERPRTPSAAAAQTAAEQKPSASSALPAAKQEPTARRGSSSSSSSNSSSSSDSSSSSSSGSDAETPTHPKKSHRVSKAGRGDLDRLQSPKTEAVAGEATGRSARVSASEKSVAEQRIPDLGVAVTKEEEISEPAPFTPGSGVRLEEDIKENQAPPPTPGGRHGGRDGKYFDLSVESPSALMKSPTPSQLKSPTPSQLKSPTPQTMKSPAVQLKSPLPTSSSTFTSPTPVNALTSPATGFNSLQSPTAVNSFTSPVSSLHHPSASPQTKSVRSTPSHMPSPANQLISSTPPKQQSSPIKSPTTFQHKSPGHSSLLNDSGNSVAEMDMSNRKMSVESDSDKSTSSIPDLTKVPTVQEALDFVEKLKMNYKETGEQISPSEMNMNKQRPTKQTDEGYVSAELALTEQGHDFAKLPQESPSMPPDPRVTTASTKEQQHHLQQQQQYDMLHLQQQQHQAYQQEYNQHVIDPRWQIQQQQQTQQHTDVEAQNREREFLLYYNEMQKRMNPQSHHQMSSYPGNSSAASMQNSYNSLNMQQHLKQFYPGANTSQVTNYELLSLYQQQQYAQYFQQHLQYPGTSGSTGKAAYNKEIGQALEHLMAQSSLAAMNKIPHYQQQQQSQHQQSHQQYNKTPAEEQFKPHKSPASSANLAQHKYQQQQQLDQHQQQHYQHQHHQQHSHPVSQSRSSPTPHSSHAAHEEYNDLLRNSMSKVQSSHQHRESPPRRSSGSEESRHQQQLLQQRQQDLELQKQQLQQQRDQLAHQLQQVQGDKNASIPSATPAEKLPGFMGGKDRSAGSAEIERVTAAANAAIEKASVGGGDNAAALAGISKDLLDSIEAVAKLPVWKPESTHESGSSPSKSMRSPDKSDSVRHAPPPEPSPNLRSIRRTSSSATSDKLDKTFDDLVKKVESSPSSRVEAHHHLQRGRRLADLGSVRTPTHSESRESHEQSDVDKSDYDETNNKGGVDYDDFDEEEDYYPPKGRALPSTSSTKITISTQPSRGRGRRRGSASNPVAPPPVSNSVAAAPPPPPGRLVFAKVRGRPKTKPVTINTKALAQVHRAVAGTDYDFEDEFGDEFGETEQREPVSLQELREQSKKQYMQQESQEDVSRKKKDVFQDFSDDDGDDFMLQQPVSGGRGRGSRGGRGGRGGGRGRGRGAKATPLVPMSRPVQAPQKVAELEQPKLPKLKLGVLLNLNRKESRSSKPEKASKSHHHKSSVSSEVKVPKLKIKLGPKPNASEVGSSHVTPVPVVPDVRKDLDETDAAVAKNLEVDEDPDDNQLIIAEDEESPKKNELEKSSSEKASSWPHHRQYSTSEEKKTLEGNFSLEAGVNREDEDEEEGRKSPTSDSPGKRGGRIEFLASRLKQAVKTPPDLDSIFGPAVPLDMTPAVSNLAISGHQTSSYSSAAVSHSPIFSGEKSELRPLSSASGPEIVQEQKSELELLQDEMALMDQKSGASPHAHNVFGPLRKAINAAKIAAESKFEEDESSNRQQHLKMKFKVGERHTSTPDPIAHSASSSLMMNAHLSGHDHRANPYSSSSAAVGGSDGQSGSAVNHIRRMRKKELLSQYVYGQEYCPAPSNGPTSLPSAVSSMLAAIDSNPSPMSTVSSVPPLPVRNIIKMPKAVASVTSVPTRADYQSQLEAYTERKRKREKCLSDANQPYENSVNKFPDKGGKKKKGKGKQNEDDEYKYKMKSISETAKEDEKKENARKTRGKPPKKCLAESPPHDELTSGDLKAESMKYAEEIRAQFENQDHKPGGAKKSKKRRIDDDASAPIPPSSKTPRLVIKIRKEPARKDVDDVSAQDPLVINDPLAIGPPSSDVAPGRNGLDQYDFDEDFGADKVTPLPIVDGTVDNFSSVNSSPAPADLTSKVPKLKIRCKV